MPWRIKAPIEILDVEYKQGDFIPEEIASRVKREVLEKFRDDGFIVWISKKPKITKADLD